MPGNEVIVRSNWSEAHVDTCAHVYIVFPRMSALVRLLPHSKLTFLHAPGIVCAGALGLELADKNMFGRTLRDFGA